MSIEIKNIKYTAQFVDDADKLLKLFKPKHEDVYAYHSTNWYKPENSDDLEIGKKSKLKIIGRAHDLKGDALLVENPKSKNKHPHITISCAKNVPPFYSNELLERASQDGSWEIFTEPVFIEVTEGYSDYDNKIVLSEN